MPVYMTGIDNRVQSPQTLPLIDRLFGINSPLGKSMFIDGYIERTLYVACCVEASILSA